MIEPTPSPPVLRIGTRGSRLARAQAIEVREALVRSGARSPELVTISTTGDRIRDRPLAEFGGKGLFAKELEDALLDGRIDVAVHSMKDLPVQLPDGLAIAAVPSRENPFDVVVSNGGRGLGELGAMARIGTSSVRRAAQIARRRSDLRIVPLRGNVDTRLLKLRENELDAVVLAAAGLRRLGIEFQGEWNVAEGDWLPALAQGALAIEMRAGDENFEWVREILDDRSASIAIACERSFQEALGGSCRSPIAGLAVLENRTLSFRGEVLAPDGSDTVATAFELALGEDPLESAARAGRDAGLLLKPAARQWLTI